MSSENIGMKWNNDKNVDDFGNICLKCIRDICMFQKSMDRLENKKNEEKNKK